MNVVRVREVDAPEDVKPVEWILYTSEKLNTLVQGAELALKFTK